MRRGTARLKRNFQFDSVSVIRWNSRLIDLHNAYDLQGFGTDLSGSETSLNFTRNKNAIDPDTLPPKVTLRCTGNVKLAFNDLGAIAAPLDDEGIEIAYFDQGCDWHSFLDEQIAARQEPQGLHVSFINGFVVRISCDMATLDTHGD